MKEKIKWQDIIIYICSFFFSIMVVLSVNMTKNMSMLETFVNDFSFDLLFWLKCFLLSLVVFVILKVILYYMTKIKIVKSKKMWDLKRITIISFCCIFLSSLLFLLVYYPGSNMNDTLYILTDPVRYSFQYPLIYCLILYFIYRTTFKITFSMNISFFMCGFIQIIFMSLVITYLIRWFHSTFKRNWCTLFLIIYFTFVSVLVNLNSALLRDPIFAGFIMLLLPLFHKIIVTKGKILNDDKFLFKLVLIMGCVCLSRNNGIYVMLLVILYLLIRYRKYLKRCFLLLIAVLLLANLPNFFPKSMQREQLFQESVAIPIQQLSFAVKYDGKLGEDDLTYLNELIEIEAIKESYNPFSVDTIKWHNGFDREHLNETKDTFIKVWLNGLSNNFSYYVKAYLLQTYELWSIQRYNPYQSEFLGIDLRDVGISRYFKDLSNEDLFPKMIQNILEKYYEYTTIYFNNATCFWLVLLLIIYCLYKKKYDYLLFFVPLIGVWGSLMIAAPLAGAFRYMCTFGYLLPFVTLYIFMNNERSDVRK